MSVVLLDGAIVHYEVLGRGRPTIFLHGWVGSWRYWISSMQAASTSFRAYALDLWGFGDTSHEKMRYTVDQQVALVSAFLNEMGIGKIALVGHGLGGVVALAFTAMAPDSVDRLMITNTPIDPENLDARMGTSSTDELVAWLASRTPDVQSALADASKADKKAIADSVNGGNYLSQSFARVGKQGTPCLVVNGQNDPAVIAPHKEISERWAYSISHIVLENSGHFPMLDDAATFNRLLTDFLALDSGSSPRELQVKDEWKRRVR